MTHRFASAPLAVVALLVAVSLSFAAAKKAPADAKDASVLNHTMKTIDGDDVNLAKAYGDKVVLIVNVASKCGYTPQYKDLQALYEKYKDKGFTIIGVPANNFGGQEPGTNSEIKQFCTSKYNVTFPMLAKVSVKGDDICPLYKQLTGDEKFGGDIKWNFEKILVVDGKIKARYPSKIKFDGIDGEIKAATAKQ